MHFDLYNDAGDFMLRSWEKNESDSQSCDLLSSWHSSTCHTHLRNVFAVNMFFSKMVSLIHS